jgi:hypothetical protein
VTECTIDHRVVVAFCDTSQNAAGFREPSQVKPWAMAGVAHARSLAMEIEPRPTARDKVSLPRGTQPLVPCDGGEGAVAVLVDDRVVRSRICDHVRSRDFFAPPVTTGLGAVLTLERARPRTAVISAPALGVPVRQIVEFLEDEYPETQRVLLGGRMDSWLADHVSEWARDLVELDALLDCMRTHMP